MSDPRPPWNDAMSDGCSVPALVRRLAPEIDRVCLDCRACCVPHDRAYYEGGSVFDKLVADAVLARAIYACTGSETLAHLFFDAVHAFGASHWGTAVGGAGYALAQHVAATMPEAP